MQPPPETPTQTVMRNIQESEEKRPQCGSRRQGCPPVEKRDKANLGIIPSFNLAHSKMHPQSEVLVLELLCLPAENDLKM